MKKLKVFLSLFILILIFCAFTINSSAKTQNFNLANDIKNNENTLDNYAYYDVYKNWLENGYEFKSDKYQESYGASSFKGKTENLVSKDESFGFDDMTYYLKEKEEVELEVNVSKTGLYYFSITYYSMQTQLLPINASLSINEEFLFSEMDALIFPIFTQDKTDFELDRYGNEMLPEQIEYKKWTNYILKDSANIEKKPFAFLLEEGKNVLKLKLDSGNILLGKIELFNFIEEIKYDDYLNKYNKNINKEYYKKYEAEKMTYKNDTSLTPEASTDLSLNPVTMVYARINSMSLYNSGDQIVYQINVPEDGYYNITLKAKQSYFENKKSVYRVYINGVVPFEEANEIEFEFSRKYKNFTLGDNYLFYLKKGDNLLTLEPNASYVNDLYQEIKKMIVEINDLGLEIKQLTGNNSDPNRDWDIKQFIPNIESLFTNWKERLDYIRSEIIKINGTKKIEEVESIEIIFKKISAILKDVDKLPYRLSLLNEGSGSITYFLGDLYENLLINYLTIDAFYIHGENVKLPKPERNIFSKLFLEIKRFFMNFFNNAYDSKLEDGEIEIWVNRSRQFLDVLQKLTDSVFTANKGIKVKFSIMPNEDKIVLACASGSDPDAAMGINPYTPYKLAIREAAYDLRNFSNINEILGNYNPGQLIPFIYDDGLYALPDSQNFHILFYRKDILNRLNIPVPTTFDEVIEILPELQRFGMNFYLPLSNTVGTKTFETFMTYYLQRNANIYSENGLDINIDSEESIKAMEFMTELYTIYSLPVQVANFYYDFRNGLIPIGIADFSTYVQLMHGAPELKGLWDIALVPGVQNGNEINHEATGLSQGMMIFESSEYKNEVWEFFNWYCSTETQIRYEQMVMTTYGKEYMWCSGNLNAIAYSQIKSEHKDVILEQLSYVDNICLTPAYYMVEREISNAWNRIIFNSYNLRDSIDEAIVNIKREMQRKNNEFGYIDDNGKMIKPYQIATIETVREWLNNGGN